MMTLVRLLILALLTVTMTSHRFVSDAAATCTMFEQHQQTCITPSSASVSVSCPANYGISIISTTVYRLPGSCPSPGSLDPSTSCQTDVQTSASLVQCPKVSPKSSCVYVATFSTSVSTCQGQYMAAVVYSCLPVYLPPGISGSTGSALTLTSSANVTNSGVTLASITRTSDTTSYFSVYVPDGYELTISSMFFIGGSTDCTTRVEFTDISGAVVAKFCTATSPMGSVVNVGCGNGTPRFYKAKYITGLPAVQSQFIFYLAVPPFGMMMAQGGTPPFPLFSVPNTTAAAKTTAALPTTASAAATPTATAAASTPAATAATAASAATAVTASATRPAATSPGATAAAATTARTAPAATAASAATAVTASAATPAATATAATGTAPAATAPAATETTATAIAARTSLAATAATGTAPASTASAATATAATAIAARTSLATYAATAKIATATSTKATNSSPVNSVSEPSGMDNLGLIIGVVIGGSVFLAIIIIVIVCCVCFRTTTDLPSAATYISPQTVSRPINYQLDPRSTDIVGQSPYRNVTQSYVDGNRTSNLVISRNEEPKIFRTVLKV